MMKLRISKWTGFLSIALLAAFLAGASALEAQDSPQGSENAPRQLRKIERIQVDRSAIQPVSALYRLVSFAGLAVMMGLAWLFSRERKLPWRLIGWGIGLQFIVGLIILPPSWLLEATSFFRFDVGGKTFHLLETGSYAINLFKDFVNAIISFTEEGARFLFGNLISAQPPIGFIFAFKVLPTIIFVSSFFAVLYYLGVMQKLVYFMGKIMFKTMGTSGSESLAAAANIFMGQTEAPLVIRPYVEKMTNSELFCLMTGGMATIAGGVLAAYAGMGIDAGHLLSASVMSAPAALLIAKLMVPEKEKSLTAGEIKLNVPKVDVNVIDAASRGASEGMSLAINVAAMLLAFVAFIAMSNAVLGAFSSGVNWAGLHAFGAEPGLRLTLEGLLGWFFFPFAFLMGVPLQDCYEIGQILGVKLVLTEFIGYLDLSRMIQDPAISLSPRSVVIATYALCGFSNFASIGIQLGGIGALAPSRRHDLAKLGLRAMIGGSLACFITATVAGILI